MSKYGRPTEGGIFDLAAIDTELRAGDTYIRDGHTAHTLLREDDLRIVVVVMKAGAQMAEHSVNQTCTIHGLSGHVQLKLPSGMTDVHPGQLLILERGTPHDVEAVSESAFLLTFGWPATSK